MAAKVHSSQGPRERLPQMKLAVLTASLLAAVVSATFPAAYTLVADGGWTVRTL
ncbi:hypothetical protein BO70DRAFT_400694 [Aspergillus heteromorphus CBS 117.55]|uniref:Uncharacterized protein n=1 Tax=Aspergillus heteromorphus CBS 117.55 TaxID=1448321 RepID=A0A317V020_9EURO|nr:uncharacterized protein BO70DRAFT_400694 [Aspergillus heteromorphus CBS 117.55]PWY66711.1 hypothetical protein BO70DRAFT_400694 [Aspergillus heteromorphus CBS 117.55]